MAEKRDYYEVLGVSKNATDYSTLPSALTLPSAFVEPA